MATLLSRGLCGPMPAAMDHIVAALENFPRYHVNEGRDFMFLSTDYRTQTRLMENSRFKGVSQNFIYASRLNGKFIKMRPIQNQRRCIVATPYTSQHALGRCVGNERDGLACPGLDNLEKTFEEFMAKRDHNMFFMGQVTARSTNAKPWPSGAAASS